MDETSHITGIETNPEQVSDKEAESTESKETYGQSFISFLKELPILIITAIVIAFVLKWLVIQPFFIPSQSMEPTLMPGDRVLVSKFIYRFVEPKQNDIIVFLAPKSDVDFIKRVIAVGGDTIEQRDGQVYVNGEKATGDFQTSPGDSYSFAPRKIEEGYVFVMGDNRSNSSDSRVFGPVPASSIIGKAFVLYWPLDRMAILH